MNYKGYKVPEVGKIYILDVESFKIVDDEYYGIDADDVEILKNPSKCIAAKYCQDNDDIALYFEGQMNTNECDDFGDGEPYWFWGKNIRFFKECRNNFLQEELEL